MKKRINKIIDLLKKDQPVYYVSTSNFTYKNGKNCKNVGRFYQIRY